MDQTTINFYNNNAADTASRYEAVSTPMAQCIQTAFAPGCRVLEIGCGSGRDLAYMHQLGYDIYGIDASEEMVNQALQYHPELKGRIEHNSVPFKKPLQTEGKFNAIYCNAVLMHLQRNELFDAALSIRDLMCKQGRLIVSMPLSRSDVDENNRDTYGRLFSNITAEEIQFLFEQLGFDLLQRCDNEDTLVEQRQQFIIEDCHTTGHRTVGGVLASARTYFPVVTHIAKLLHS